MGGWNSGGTVSSSEIYDSLADRWTSTISMSVPRRFFTATLLPNGKVLASGGSEATAGTSAEVFTPDNRTRLAPRLTQPSDPVLRTGQALLLHGAGFHVATDSGNSSYSNSASNLPVLQLRRLDNGAVTFLASTEFSPGSLQSAPLPAEPMAQGWYAATVFVNGTASNSVILRASRVPDEPSLTDATAQNGGVHVTWSAPADDGGAPVTSYVVTAYDHANPAVALGTGCTVSAADLAGGCRITGLSNSIAYVIHVQAVNQIGVGMPAISIPVIPLAVTSAPNSVTAAPGDGQITVTWTAPTDGNGSPIAGYMVNAYVDGQPGTSVGQCTVASPATQCIVTNLTNGTNYLFSVTAHSSDGGSTAAFSVSAVAPVLSVSILSSAALPNGRVGEAYSTTIMLMGGSGSYWLSQPPGSLPDGLVINVNDAGTGFIISGTPSKTQTVRFTLTISDNTVGWQTRQKSGPTVRTVTQEFSLTVLAAAGAAPVVATPVPTLNSWGLWGLTAIFAVFAMTGARRAGRKGALRSE